MDNEAQQSKMFAHAQSKYWPDNRAGFVGRWIAERSGISERIARFLNYPVPKYVEMNVLYALGGLTLIALIFQVITGILLSFYYNPSPEDAYNSVDYITYIVPLGWLMRGIHHYNASAIVILVALHMLRTFFFSAYKKPRELTWLSGILLLLVTLAFGFTGYLLPWDQTGYWATKVGTETAGLTPFIGHWIATILRGGEILGQATLTRFYIIHTLLLPLLLFGLTTFHYFQHRYHGVAPNIIKPSQAVVRKFVPFFPNWVVMDVILGLGLLTLLVYFSWSYRAPLEFPADPTSTNFDPRPEWYFLFLFQLLHYMPAFLEPLAVVLLPILVIGSMILLPFLDRNEERRPWRKPVTTGIALFYIVSVVLLTLLAL